MFVVLPVAVFAESYPQEMHISAKGEADFIGAEMTNKHALNLIAVKIWNTKWFVSADSYTKFESAYGKEILSSELSVGDILEVKGKPTADQDGSIGVEATLIKDLSIKTGVPPVEPIAQPAPTAQIAPVPVPVPVATVLSGEKKTITQNLKLGMRGAEVALLQNFLQKNDWGISKDEPVTGYFGKLTKQALMKFQEANSLEAIGSAGPRTRALINSLLGKQ